MSKVIDFERVKHKCLYRLRIDYSLLLESGMTMDFKRLDITTIPEVRPFLKYSQANTCDFTVGGIYMWRKYFDMQYAIVNGVYYSRLFDSHGNEFYNLPLSEDMLFL